MNAQQPAPTWEQILPEPFVSLIIGKRGGGKTATGHRLLEVFGRDSDDRDAYIMGYPEGAADELPEWIDTIPATTSLNDWPEDSVVLVHEAHHIAHAREHQDAENLSIDKLVTVSRHRNSDIIFETQQTQRLDRNFPAAVDGIIVKQPALMQQEFERRQMKTIIREANDVFDNYRTVQSAGNYEYVEEDPDIVKHAYVYADRFRGEYPHEIQLADHFSEDISKAYGDHDMFGGDGDDDESDGGLSKKESAALHEVAAWEHENRPLSFDHLGAEYSDTSVSGNVLGRVAQKGLLEKVYSSSNKPNRYRLTADGWDALDVDEPDGPVVAEED